MSYAKKENEGRANSCKIQDCMYRKDESTALRTLNLGTDLAESLGTDKTFILDVELQA